MKRKKAWKIWIWNFSGTNLAAMSKVKPFWANAWHDFRADGYWLWDQKWWTREQLFVHGLKELPPRGVAWLVEVTAPGRSRIVKRMKGEK